MLFLSTILVVRAAFAATNDWSARADTLLQALSRQTELISNDNANKSGRFQQWCQQTLPWTQSLISMLQQQRLESENVERQVQSNIARMRASKVLDRDAVDTRTHLVGLANVTISLANNIGSRLDEMATKSHDALDHDVDGAGQRIGGLVKELHDVMQGEREATEDRTALHNNFIMHAKMTDKAQKVEMRNLEVQLSERKRTRAKYQSEALDLMQIEQVARNSSRIMDATCHHQAQNSQTVKSALEAVIAKARAVENQSNPMALLFLNQQASKVLNFLQLQEPKLEVQAEQPAVINTGIAQDLLKDINALTAEEQEEESLVLVGGHKVKATERNQLEAADEKANLEEWCQSAQAKSESTLMAQASDLRHTKARIKLAKTNGMLLMEQLDYFSARRKEIELMLKNLEKIIPPQNAQEDLDTFTHQTLILAGSGVPTMIANELHLLIDALGHGKYSLGLRGHLWKTWTQDMSRALALVDHHIGSTVVHFQRRQKDAGSEAAFLETVQRFAVEDYELQKMYHKELEEACRIHPANLNQE